MESDRENILLKDDKIIFSYKQSFKHSDSFKRLFNEYLEQTKTVPYWNLKKMISKKFSRLKIIRISEEDKDIGFVILEQDGDSCHITPFVTINDLSCVEYLIKKINQDFLDYVGIKNIETLYFGSYNQKRYEEIYEKQLTHFATEFYKAIDYDSEQEQNDILFKKKDGDIEYLYIYNRGGLDTDLLKYYDEAFFYEDLPNQDNYESKYDPKQKSFDYIIKVTLKHKYGVMIDIGLIGISDYDSCLSIAPYFAMPFRKKGLYSYFIKKFNKCSWIFKNKPEYLVGYVFTKNKVSTKVHETLFKKISFKCYKKDIK